jgi:hypothetical protein
VFELFDASCAKGVADVLKSQKRPSKVSKET